MPPSRFPKRGQLKDPFFDAKSLFLRQLLTTRVEACALSRRLGRTTISTSWPRAFRNRKSRSVENPSSLPRTRAETFGWSIPRTAAARAWVSFRSQRMAPPDGKVPARGSGVPESLIWLWLTAESRKRDF